MIPPGKLTIHANTLRTSQGWGLGLDFIVTPHDSNQAYHAKPVVLEFAPIEEGSSYGEPTITISEKLCATPSNALIEGLERGGFLKASMRDEIMKDHEFHKELIQQFMGKL